MTTKSGTQAAPMVSAALANYSAKKNISASELEKKLFKSLKPAQQLADVSVSGSFFHPSSPENINLSPKARRYRLMREDLVTGQLIRIVLLGCSIHRLALLKKTLKMICDARIIPSLKILNGLLRILLSFP